MNSLPSLSLPKSAIRSIAPLAPNQAVQLPRAGHSETEELLAEATTHAYDQAVARLTQLVPDFRFVHLANTTDDNRFQIAPTFGEEAARKVQPLELDAIEADLVRVFGCVVEQAPVESGQRAGWVTHDQIVFQHRGASTWRITSLTELSPLPHYSDPAVSDAEVWAGQLPAGAAMYIPRGWGHEASDTDGTVRFALHRWTGIDVIQTLAFAAGDAPLLRAHAPADVAASTFAYDDHVFGHGGFADALSALATLENVDAALSRLQSTVGAEAAKKRAVQPISRDAMVTLNAPTGIRWVAPRTETADSTAGTDHRSDFAIAFRGQVITWAPEALAAVARLAQCEPIRVNELDGLLPAEFEAETAVARLAAHNLVTIDA